MFKEGEWLIRRWSKENGGETDFVRFGLHIDEKKFSYTKFYRVKNGKIRIIADSNSNTIAYRDDRMIVQFRKATKVEINRYAIMIFNKDNK